MKLTALELMIAADTLRASTAVKGATLFQYTEESRLNISNKIYLLLASINVDLNEKDTSTNDHRF